MPNLAEIRSELEAKQSVLAKAWEQAGPERNWDNVTILGDGDVDAKLAEMRRRDAEINELADQEQKYAYMEMIGRSARDGLDRSRTPASNMVHPGSGTEPYVYKDGDLGKALRKSEAYKAYREGRQRSFTFGEQELPGVGWKTITTVSSMQPQAQRGPTQEMGVETRTIIDLMRQGQTDRAQFDYFEETTLTNAADTVAESGLKPESALAWTLRTETVRKIATWVPATKEAMDDIPMVESILRGRLGYMVERAEEAQVLSGDGVAPNLLGIMARGIQTQAKGALPTPDAVYMAMQKVRGADGSGFAEPSAIVFHPNDWTAIKLLRTDNGIYIWGNPSDAAPDRIWGMNVRQTTAMTEGTALVGAFSTQAEVFRREGLSITVATEDGSDFLYNRVKIMAESRLALAVYRPTAFASVTGI